MSIHFATTLTLQKAFNHYLRAINFGVTYTVKLPEQYLRLHQGHHSAIATRRPGVKGSILHTSYTQLFYVS